MSAVVAAQLLLLALPIDGGGYRVRTASTIDYRIGRGRVVTGTPRLQICLVQIAGDSRASRSIDGFDASPNQLDGTVLL